MSILWAMVVSGSRRKRLLSSRIGWGMVAENRTRWQSAGLVQNELDILMTHVQHFIGPVQHDNPRLLRRSVPRCK
ncbi:MAG: hypothetical protein ACLSHC_14285 [Bilophila wadsworthia]